MLGDGSSSIDAVALGFLVRKKALFPRRFAYPCLEGR